MWDFSECVIVIAIVIVSDGWRNWRTSSAFSSKSTSKKVSREKVYFFCSTLTAIRVDPSGISGRCGVCIAEQIGLPSERHETAGSLGRNTRTRATGSVAFPKADVRAPLVPQMLEQKLVEVFVPQLGEEIVKVVQIILPEVLRVISQEQMVEGFFFCGSLPLVRTNSWRPVGALHVVDTRSSDGRHFSTTMRHSKCLDSTNRLVIWHIIKRA